MIALFYFFRQAVRNLLRGGQRVWIALVCITFGVMALVAMTLIAKPIENAILVEPSQLIGGDLSIVRAGGEVLTSADVDQLKALQARGELSRFTRIAYNSSSILFRTADSGEMHFVGTGMGIEPDVYPLAGSLVIGEPGSTGLATLLQQAGDVIVTRDIAGEYHLQVGDSIVLSDLHYGIPVPGTVRGIAYDTPNHQGDKVYYTLETAQTLADGQAVINTVIANSDRADAALQTLENSGWSVDWTAQSRAGNPANLWILGLRSAGILGLLVSGIGIANTMQVLLRRRQPEIAVWKTLGYRSGHLNLIFTFEAGLLGLTGSLLGAGLGILISGYVLDLFRRISTVLYQWTFSPVQPLLGVLVGTLTTLIFASWAILLSGQARPMALLRNERIDVPPVPGCVSAGLGLFLMIPFTALAGWVLESLPAGIGVVFCILAGIAVLGAFFSGLLWLCTHLLPLRGFPVVRMAFNNLHRRGTALIFAMIAIFIGTLSMSLGLAAVEFSQSKASGNSPDFQGYNLEILAPFDQENAVRQAVQAQSPETVGIGYRTALAGLRLADSDEPIPNLDPILVGRSTLEDYHIVNGADWGSQRDQAVENGVYVFHSANLAVGSQVEVTFRDGTSKTFTVLGSYDVTPHTLTLFPPLGLLMPAEAFTRVTPPDSVTVFARFAPAQLRRAAAVLGTALPDTTILDLVEYAGRFMHSYKKLIGVPLALAGLALLGGFLLVANSVSLAMLDRRYEIGILKTTGYSRRQILSVFAVEYGLVGFLATTAGLLPIEGTLAVLALADRLPASALLLSLPSVALVAVCGIGLTLLTVLGVTWNPTRVPPVFVLNERN